MELDLPFSVRDPIIDEVEEPSVLEYAREQGISVDYTTELPRLVDICLSLRDAIDLDPADPFEDELANAVTTTNQLLKQKVVLPVPRDAAVILRTLRVTEAPLTSRNLVSEGLQRIRDLKQELPVLRTDAELDMLSFGRKVELEFADLRTRLPTEELDEDKDEGFGWPAECFAYPAQCDAKIRKEKLAVTREALECLQNAVRNESTAKDNQKLMDDAMENRPGLVPRHLTPPLLPLSPPSLPYIPSSPANHLPLIPESSDSVAAEAKALEQEIMAKDSLLRLHSGSSESMLLDGDVTCVGVLSEADKATTPPSSDRIPRILKRKGDDLKVEGPLTPPMFSDSPLKKLKSVSFAKLISVGTNLEPWPGESDPMTGSESTMDDLRKAIEPIAKEAKAKAENEKLTGADTIARVEVPYIDFALPVAPWDEFSRRRDSKRRLGITELEAQMRFLQRVKREDLKSATAWRGVSDLDLNWGWFASPTSTTIKVHEKLHGETEFHKIQAELKAGEFATSSKEVWKKDGLRVLDDDDDDDDEDEVESADFEERSDMDTLIRKRKLELELGKATELREAQRKRQEAAVGQVAPATHQSQNEGYGITQGQHATFVQLLAESKSPAIKPKTTRTHGEAPTELMFGGFSASSALHKFMATQGKAIQAAKADPNPIVQPVGSSSNVPISPFGLSAISERGHAIEHPADPVPELARPFDLPASSCIVSLALLQRRSLVKEIERLHTNANLIYRDYTLPHCGTTEADVILSPSTGVLLTTLQQIKQQPLPGQAARSQVKERMVSMQKRYERLVVLVSEGLREELGYGRPEDARDKETLKDLEVFAAQLEGDVSVKFVFGGDKALAKAVVEGTAKYGLPHDGKEMEHIKLFAMETTWEAFLRRAGLNPFAAQVIIASLKTPTLIAADPLPSSPASYGPHRTLESTGLSTFLLMEREDRAKHFQAILGGRRILDRVSALLDQRWLGAAHGFRM